MMVKTARRDVRCKIRSWITPSKVVMTLRDLSTPSCLSRSRWQGAMLDDKIKAWNYLILLYYKILSTSHMSKKLKLEKIAALVLLDTLHRSERIDRMIEESRARHKRLTIMASLWFIEASWWSFLAFQQDWINWLWIALMADWMRRLITAIIKTG